MCGGPPVIFLQPRPGPKLPEGESYLTIGWKQVRGHFVLLHLLAYFELDLCCFEGVQEIAIHIYLSTGTLSPVGCRCSHHNKHTTLTQWWFHWQGMGTSITLVSICQNEHFTFSFLQNTYLSLVRVVTCAASVFVTWHVQRYWRIDIKKMV